MSNRAATAGWYADPLERATFRYWDGRAWTAYVADAAQHTWTDPRFEAEERARASARVAVPPGQARPIAEPGHEARSARPQRPPRTPWRTRLGAAWRTARHRVAADLAVHWLAYLGVTLIFVGVFGFLAFTFDEVRAGWRPIAELLIPASLFGASWYLARQGAPFAGRAVAGLAGALVPIVAIASLNDGASIPPDLDGAVRAYTAGLACLAIGATYAWWSARHPDSPLRFIAGPAVWLGVGVALAATRTPMPTGPDIARADAWQAAGMAIAIAVSVALARFRPDHPVAEGVRRAALPGVVVSLAFVAANSIVATHRPTPTVVALVAAIVTLDLVVAPTRATVAAAVESLLAVVAVIALAPDVPLALQGTIGAVVAVALAEWHGRRAVARALLGAMFVAAAVGLVVAADDWWAMAVAWGTLGLWASVRRVVRPGWLRVEGGLEYGAAVLPLGFALAVHGLSSDAVGTAVLAGVALAAIVALRWSRPANDMYARVWAMTAFVGLEASTVIVAAGPNPAWVWLAVAAAMLAVSVAFLRIRRAAHWLLGAAALAWTSWLALQALEVSSVGPMVRTAVLAVLAVVLTAGATRRRDELRPLLLAAGASSAFGALWSLGDWLAWDERMWCIAIGATAGTAAVAVVALQRLLRIGAVWTWPWAIGAALGAMAAGGLAIGSPSRVGDGAPGEVAAVALLLVAVAGLALAGPWRQAWFGELAALSAFVGAGSLAVGLSLSPEMLLLCTIGLGGSVTSAVVNLWRRGPHAPAVRTGLELSALLAIAGVIIAPSVGRPAMGMVFAFGSIAVQAFAYAYSWRMPALSTISSVATAIAAMFLSIEYEWSGAQRIRFVAIAGAGAVVLAVALARWSRLSVGWLGPWLVPGLFAVAGAVTAVVIDVDGVGIGPTGYLTAGAAFASLAAVDLAETWRAPAWRWWILPAVGGAVACTVTAAELGTVATARVAAGLGFAATLAVIGAWLTARTRPFAVPAAWLAVSALVVGGLATTQAAIDAEAWHPVAGLAALMLFVAGAESWTFGNFWHLRAVEELTPAWLAAAWCAFASSALGGNAQWYTVPIGVALLGVEEIERHERREAGQPASNLLGRLVEYLGMALVVSASYFQTFTRSASFAFVGIVLGIALTAWGVLTQVRRRAIFGGVATLVATVLIVAVPLAGVLPGAPAAAVWLGLAGVGVLALVAAATVERGVRLVRRGVDRLDHSTEGWE